jgi:hypothetical protein
MHADDRANLLTLCRDTAIAQLAGPPVLANPLSRRLGQPIGSGDMDVAAKANDVVEAKSAQLGEQLLVAKPAVGQDRDQASWRHELAQAPQAGVPHHRCAGS